MSLPTRNLSDVAWALATARRVAGDDVQPQGWTDDDWRAELANHAVTRSGVTYLNPYAAALVFVSSPRNVTQRQEGSEQETYTPPYLVIQQLQALSVAWAAEVDTLAPIRAASAPDLTLTIKGW